jgi:hypothetical protein
MASLKRSFLVPPAAFISPPGYLRLSGRAHPRQSGTGPHGDILLAAFATGRPSLSQPSGGFLVCQQGHRRACSIWERKIRIANTGPGALRFFNRAGTFLAFIYFEPGGRRILPCGLFIERQSEAHDRVLLI